MSPEIAIVFGLIGGAGLVGAVWLVWQWRASHLTSTLLEDTRVRQAQELCVVIEQLKTSFAALSRDALSSNSEDFLELAGTKLSDHTKQGEAALDVRKKLIDKTVEQMTTRLVELSTALQTLDKDRRQAHGSLIKHLETATQATGSLQQTTAQLREALAHPQRRGQWGERMADDVLQLAGFVEGINYLKQAITSSGSKPDFTFVLPQGRCVNMDVKFPLANYLKFLEVPSEDPSAKQHKDAFLSDVRKRVKEVTGRGYIDPSANTVDYVLVFIPNEQIYAFIHQNDPDLMDDALRQKVVLCSPFTLYAVMSVIRQAAEQFRLEQTSREILNLLDSFRKEWGKYTDGMDRMGKALSSAMAHYEALNTTRTRKLENQLDKIDHLQAGQHPAPPATLEPGGID